jgi:hypothetical protein
VIFSGQKFGARLLLAVAPFALFLCSCRSIPELPAINLNAPGWNLRQGQAVWRSERDKPEIAGELVLATRGDETMLQLSKNPLPFVTVQTSGRKWQVNFAPQRRRFSGIGEPTTRLLWVYLARALNGVNPPPPLKFEQTAQGFSLENPSNGEMVSGFLNP